MLKLGGAKRQSKRKCVNLSHERQSKRKDVNLSHEREEETGEGTKVVAKMK